MIFGISGQDGYYLKQLLINEGIEVIGVSRSNINYVIGNVADYSFVEELIKKHQPTYIFHLAADSTTQHVAMFENYQSISTGTINILEAVYKFSKLSKVFISGSGLQFINNSVPIKETDPFVADDSYSMARIQSVYACRYYRSIGINVYIGYFFNHDSPLRSERHVNKKITMAARRIANGQTEKLLLGDISIQKEFAYAGDIVKAMWLFINNDSVFETVIGSGNAYPLSYWIDFCFSYYKLNWEDHTIIDKGFASPYKILVSNPTTLHAMGWQPQVNIDELAQMMLNDVR